MPPITPQFRYKHECAKAWAQGELSEGRGPRLFFVGPTLYSDWYSFPIATISGPIAFFIEEPRVRRYAIDKAIAKAAVADKTIINVPEVPIGANAFYDTAAHQGNINIWLGEMAIAMDSIVQFPRWRCNRQKADDCKQKIRALVQAVNFPVSQPLQDILDHAEPGNFQQLFQAERKRQAPELRRQLLPKKKEFYRQLRFWDKGELSYVEPPEGMPPVVHLRWNERRKKISSSLGNHLSKKEAYAMWRRYTKARAEGQKRFFLQGSIVAILSKNWLKTTCHHVPIAQIDKIAAQLGWT